MHNRKFICKKCNFLGIVSGGISIALFAFDIISTRLEAFYKIFHGNEQKTPFLTTLVAAFLFFASSKEVNFFVIPALYVSHFVKIFLIENNDR